MIVIGDCHGCYDELMEMISILPKGRELCFVGDLIDRGPKSKEVVDFVKDNGHKCVMGNHELMLCDSFTIHDGELITHTGNKFLWIQNGGDDTIKSFDDNLFDYIDWFKALPYYIEYEYDDKYFIISHSYAYNGIDTYKYDLVWNRILTETPYEYDRPFINIYGHTPHKKAKVYHDKHWCIDTGCFYGFDLTAIDLHNMKLYTIKGKGQNESI